MTVIRASRVICPCCDSIVSVATHDNGMLEVWHHDPFGPDCDAELRSVMAETAGEHGLRLMLRN